MLGRISAISAIAEFRRVSRKARGYKSPTEKVVAVCKEVERVKGSVVHRVASRRLASSLHFSG